MSGTGITRRSFIKGSIVAGALMAKPFSRALGANDDIRVAVIGFRGMGKTHIGGFSNIDGVRVVALCDADKQILAKHSAKDKYTDLRRIMDDKNIDAVVTATPHHWHALITVWACQTGKDVYVEKPASHSIWEGTKMVEAARKYKRMVQVGTQRRSNSGMQAAVKYVQEGNIGKIQWIHSLWFKGRDGIGNVRGPVKVPSHIDYNLWTGPAPLRPLMRKNLHYDWHFFWEQGNGDLCNTGIHQIDVGRWFSGEAGPPPRVMSFGGRLGFEDDGQTPNTHLAVFDYDAAPILLEVRGLRHNRRNTSHYKGIHSGNVVKCEHGTFVGNDGGGVIYDNDGKKIKKISGQGGPDHRHTFINAVRSRKVSDLTCDILEGHRSAVLAHMANISYRLGQRCPQEKISESIKGNKAAMETFESIKGHLSGNKVDLEKTPMTLGPWLKWDSAKDKFTGDFPAKWANTLIKDSYREPFVIPEKV